LGMRVVLFENNVLNRKKRSKVSDLTEKIRGIVMQTRNRLEVSIGRIGLKGRESWNFGSEGGKTKPEKTLQRGKKESGREYRVKSEAAENRGKKTSRLGRKGWLLL